MHTTNGARDAKEELTATLLTISSFVFYCFFSPTTL
jgi:hypothetical protein